MNLRNSILLAKQESSYGVDPTLTGASNAILCSEPKVEPIVAEAPRDYIRGYFGNTAPIKIGEGIKITFSTELKGSGAAGTAPEIGPLLQACNMTETVDAGVSVTYALNSLTNTAESVAIEYYLDGTLHQILGCRGTFKISAETPMIPMIEWEFTGIYAAPSDDSNPSPTFNSTDPPPFVSATFSIASYSAIIKTIEIDIANEVNKRSSANASTGVLSYFIGDRKSTMKIDPEVVALATWNPWTNLSSTSLLTVAGAFGSSAGNICTLAAKANISSIGYGERDGKLAVYDLNTNLCQSAGNDELSLVFT